MSGFRVKGIQKRLQGFRVCRGLECLGFRCLGAQGIQKRLQGFRVNRRPRI